MLWTADAWRIGGSKTGAGLEAFLTGPKLTPLRPLHIMRDNLRSANQISLMRPLSKDHLAGRLRKLHKGLRHAFSTQPPAAPFSSEELDLMERIADALVKRGMAAPAMMFFESMGPMNFLGSQALHFLTPIIECAFEGKDFERIARLLERRDTLSRLIAVIEHKVALQRASAR